MVLSLATVQLRYYTDDADIPAVDSGLFKPSA